MTFLTLQANVYTVVPIDGGPMDTIVNNTAMVDDAVSMSLGYNATEVIRMAGGISHMRLLSSFECLDAYKAQYVSSLGDVLVIQSGAVVDHIRTAFDGSDLPVYKQIPYWSSPSDYPSNRWRCNPQSNRTCIQPELGPPVPWNPYGKPVQYCLSEVVPERCELSWNLQLGIIVVGCNIIKVICMFLTLWRHDISALITLGDAIQSFLDRPDPHTQGFCIYSDHLIQLLMKWEEDAPLVVHDFLLQRDFYIDVNREQFLSHRKSKQWRPSARRWWSAVSSVRWWMCVSL